MSGSSNNNQTVMKGVVFRKKKKIVGKTLSLIQTHEKHIEELYRNLTSNGVMEMLTVSFQEFADFKRYFYYIKNQWEFNKDFTYTIMLDNNRPIGQISIYDYVFKHKRAEIGIWIGSKYWGKDYGKLALELLLKHAFVNLVLNRIQAHIFTQNERSISLFERFGFSHEGIIREFIWKDDAYVDVHVYALLKQHWEEKNKT